MATLVHVDGPVPTWVPPTSDHVVPVQNLTWGKKRGLGRKSANAPPHEPPPLPSTLTTALLGLSVVSTYATCGRPAESNAMDSYAVASVVVTAPNVVKSWWTVVAVPGAEHTSPGVTPLFATFFEEKERGVRGKKVGKRMVFYGHRPSFTPTLPAGLAAVQTPSSRRPRQPHHTTNTFTHSRNRCTHNWPAGL
jgi:hypothetical protein